MKFLEEIAARLKATHGNRMENVVVCFPNNRVGFYFQKILSNATEKPTFLPKIITLTDFVYQYSSLTKTEPLALKLLLHKHYSQLSGNSSITKTLQLADTFLNDFEELTANDIHIKSFFRDLKNLKSMNVAFDDDDTEKLSYQQFWSDFEQLYHQFTQDLLQQKKGFNGLLFREVADKLDSLIFDFSHIYFVGFTTLTATEEKIIRYCCEKKQGIFWADIDDYYFNDKQHAAGFFYRKYAEKWWKKEEQHSKNKLSIQQKNIDIIGVAKNIGQVKVAADFIHRHPNEDTAVILLDSALLQPLLYELPKNTESYNVSMGLPLQQTAVHSFLTILNQLISSKKIEKDIADPLFYYEDIIALFQHEFLQNLFSTSGFANKITAEIKTQNTVYVALSALTPFLTDAGITHLSALLSETATVRLHHTLEQTLRQIVQYTENKKNATAEREALKYCIKAMLQFQEDLLTLLSERDYMALLLAETKAVRIPVEPDYDSPLQLLGIMETRAFDFENIVLVSCNEGIFPTGKHIQSFIPFELRQNGMTTHYTKDSIASYLFYRLFHYAKNITIIYNTQPDRLGGGEVSRFVMQVENEFTNNKNYVIERKTFSLNGQLANNEKQIHVKKTDKVLTAIQQYISDPNKGLSPSALSSFLQCSLQFYFNYILKMKESEDIDENIASYTFGTVLHHVLEEIFTPLKNKVLHASDLDKFTDKTVIRQLLIAAFKQERYEERSLMEGSNYLELILSEEYLYSFLLYEKNRIAEHLKRNETITITHLEETIKHSIAIGDTHVMLMGKSDRIETVNGQTQIWDYKTGKHNSLLLKAMEDINQPKKAKLFQLMMYGYLTTKQLHIPHLQSGIIWLKKTTDKYESLSVEKSKNIGKEELDKFENILTSILSDMLNESIPITQTDDREICTYCPYIAICGR